jgi:hypothetical protein
MVAQKGQHVQCALPHMAGVAGFAACVRRYNHGNVQLAIKRMRTDGVVHMAIACMMRRIERDGRLRPVFRD